MNLSILSETAESLLEYMRLQKYSEPYVVRHTRMLNHISKHAVERGWTSFSDVLQWYRHQTYTQLYLADVKKVLSNLEYFHERGSFPGNGAIQRELREKHNSLGQLNLSFLQEHLKELLNYMLEHDYSKQYCRTVSYIARRIIVLSRTLSWNSYLEVWKWYQSQNLKSTYLQNVCTVLGLLEKFHLSGEMPNNRETQSTLCTRDSAYSKLVPPYRNLVDFSISLAEQRDLSKGFIRSMKAVASSFLLAMQQAGADGLEKINSELINDYFHSVAIRVNGRGISPRLIRFFKDCITVNEECRRIIFIIPRIPSGRKNIQYITKEEGKAFCNALLDFGNGLTYKARAIGTILFYTGTRGIDIVNLRLDSIDLQQKTISLIQSKTRNPLVLPLSPVVGNAIYDYCVMERPNTASLNLFVGNNAPHHKVGTGTVNIAVDSIMEVAGIRQKKGNRKGSHIFRHRMATTLMENNISPAVISATLGHASPDSLDSYLYADKIHLKECALSLPHFQSGRRCLPMHMYDSTRMPLFDSFVQYRKASNQWSTSYDINLVSFDRYCSKEFSGISGLTQQMVNGWCTQKSTESKASCTARVQVTRTLIKYLQERNLTDIILPTPLASPPNQYIPHAFTEAELSAFFNESDAQVIQAKTEKSAFDALVVSVIFRLLYSSGMRTTEARLLKVENVDLAHGVVSIQTTKGNHQHYVVLHDDALAMLINYDIVANKNLPQRVYFFPTDNGDIITSNRLYWMFRKVWERVNKSHAVPYDLRHHYAITNINAWIDSGFEFHDKFLYLSKSMGHTKLDSTKYYYSLVPSLADVIYRQSGADFDAIVPEVPTNE